ncbi:glycosyltransferase family 39 protein [bacterium]|nr:glycosyltransferase family 39 protein [bacterium]
MEQRETTESKRPLRVIAVFAAVAIAYLVSIPGKWAVHPDSAFYMTVGRSLAEGEGYTVNGDTFGKYPPVYPALLAVVYGAAGESFWWLQFVGAMSGVGACVTVYLWARGRTGVRTSLAVAVLTVTTTWFWNNACASIISGIPYVFLAFGVLWLAERAIRAERYSVWGWVGIALLTWLAIYIHMSGVALVAAIVGAVLFAKGAPRMARQRLIAAGLVGVLCTGAAACWLFNGRKAGQGRNYNGLIHNEPMRVLADPYGKLQMRAREWLAAPLSRDYEEIPEVVAFVVLGLLLAPGLVRGFRRERSVAELYLLVYFAVQYLHGGKDGHQRYVLPALPLLFYYGQESLRILGALLPGKERPRVRRAVLTALFIGLAGHGVYSVIRSRNGASDINAREKLEAQAERLAMTTDCIVEHVPEDATVYAADGGAAWVIFHYTTRRRMGKCLQFYTHDDLLKGMVEWEADFALKTKGQLQPHDVLGLLEGRPEFFTFVAKTDRCQLFRIDKDALKTHVETLK